MRKSCRLSSKTSHVVFPVIFNHVNPRAHLGSSHVTFSLFLYYIHFYRCVLDVVMDSNKHTDWSIIIIITASLTERTYAVDTGDHMLSTTFSRRRLSVNDDCFETYFVLSMRKSCRLSGKTSHVVFPVIFNHVSPRAHLGLSHVTFLLFLCYIIFFIDVFSMSSWIVTSTLVHNGVHIKLPPGKYRCNFSIHLKFCDLEDCTF